MSSYCPHYSDQVCSWRWWQIDQQVHIKKDTGYEDVKNKSKWKYKKTVGSNGKLVKNETTYHWCDGPSHSGTGMWCILTNLEPGCKNDEGKGNTKTNTTNNNPQEVSSSPRRMKEMSSWLSRQSPLEMQIPILLETMVAPIFKPSLLSSMTSDSHVSGFSCQLSADPLHIYWQSLSCETREYTKASKYSLIT
jgi:hypothetical protein